MNGRIAIPEDEHTAAFRKRKSYRADPARLETIRNAIANNPGISIPDLCRATGIPRTAIDGNLLTLENHGWLLTEDENCGLHLLQEIR